MINHSILNHLKKGYVTSSALVLISFSSAFFSRSLDSLGAPSPVNFLHFATVPFAFGFILLKSRVKNRYQRSTIEQILIGLLILLAIGFASAILNDVGLINVILDFLLLAEPFLLLVAIISIPHDPERTRELSFWISAFVFFHLFLIYVQYGAGFCNMDGDCDNIQGVFYRSGSGHVVGTSVSTSFAAYFFAMARKRPLWLRSLVLIIGFGNVILADAKQVLLTFIVGFAILALMRQDLKKAILYVIGLIIFTSIFIWAIYNIEALGAFTTWIRPELYGPEGEATKLKLAGIRITMEYMSSPLHLLFGLGPGHTIDRLGGWMLRDYASLLAPLGSTQSPIGSEVWQYVASSWLAEGSSMFSPFWGWAGIWGDLGFLGLASYLYLCSIVWMRLCKTEISRLLMLTAMVHGFIFTQMEEPGYMLTIAMLIAIGWHEYQARHLTKY
jgi:hypothetical protein